MKKVPIVSKMMVTVESISEMNRTACDSMSARVKELKNFTRRLVSWIKVLLNLLVNAARSIEGTGEIKIKTFEEGGKIVLKFRDKGRGFSQDHLKRIF